jgi:hypothetical protein
LVAADRRDRRIVGRSGGGGNHANRRGGHWQCRRGRRPCGAYPNLAPPRGGFSVVLGTQSLSAIIFRRSGPPQCQSGVKDCLASSLWLGSVYPRKLPRGSLAGGRLRTHAPCVCCVAAKSRSQGAASDQTLPRLFVSVVAAGPSIATTISSRRRMPLNSPRWVAASERLTRQSITEASTEFKMQALRWLSIELVAGQFVDETTMRNNSLTRPEFRSGIERQRA